MEHRELHRADRTYRRRVIASLIISALLGAVGVAGLQLWLDDAMSRSPQLLSRWLPRLLCGVTVLMAFGSAFVARQLTSLAKDVRIEKRWPPESMQTIADVPVLRNEAATRQVRMLLGLRIVFWVFSGLLLLWGVMVFGYFELGLFSSKAARM